MTQRASGYTATEPAPSRPRWIDGPALDAALPMADAVQALETALRNGEVPAAPRRSWVEHGTGQVVMMPATGSIGAGVKLVTVQPENPARGLPFVQGVYVLFDATTLAPVAMFAAAELTRLRTPAVSALATKYLARPDARRLVVFGAGVQARGHVEAMRAVRPIEQVTVVSPTHAGELVEQLLADGLDAAVGAASAVSDADIVCACTTSPSPLFDGSLLPAGVHVNAIGAFQPHTREVDTATVVRARVVVELRDAALAEAGDLQLPIREGAVTAEHVVAELEELVAGRDVRQGAGDITLFKSVGVAFEDLIIAAAAFRQAGAAA